MYITDSIAAPHEHQQPRIAMSDSGRNGAD